MAILICGSKAVGWGLAEAETVLEPYYAKWGLWAFTAALIVFVVLLAVPFLPGVELGWAMMMVFGWSGVVVVYCAALFAFSLSYAVGRRIPLSAVVTALNWLRMRQAGAWISSLADLDPEERQNLLLRKAPARWIPFLLKHRYVALVVLLNLPGNSMIGGGGGIALLAGLSRLYSYPGFLAAVALAAAPVPVLMLVKPLVPLAEPFQWLRSSPG